MPELLWKAYIDFEVEEGERARARALYERLAAASGHWKVWVAYAMFEAQPIQLPRDEREDEDEEGDEEDEEKEPKMVEGDLELARQVFQKGYKDLKNKGLKNEVSRNHPSFHEREGRIRIIVSDDIWIIWLAARRTVTGLEVIRGTARHSGRHRKGRRNDACAGQAALRRRGDRAARGRYAYGSISLALRRKDKTYSIAMWQITTTFLQMTNARRIRLHSSSFKWHMHGRPRRRPARPVVVPEVAVAVHQGSLRRKMNLAGPNLVPWTRTRRVWRARHDAFSAVSRYRSIVISRLILSLSIRSHSTISYTVLVFFLRDA